MWLLLLLSGCGGPEIASDDKVAALGAAVKAWEQAKERLDAGDPAGALPPLEAALAARPGDPLLLAWQARALAATGEHERAKTQLDGVVKAHPAFHVARYDRAVERARLGDVSGAAEDLRAVLEAGAATPRGLVRDPDLAPYLGDPALEFLPRAPMDALCRLPEGKLWWGSEVAIELSAVGASAGPLAVALTATEGPLQLDRVVEDDVLADGGDRTRVWTWTFRVTGPGEALVGPARVTQGALTVEVPCGPLAASAPEGKPAKLAPLRFPNPGEVAGERTPPAAWRDRDQVIALARPRQRVVAEPEQKPVWSGQLRKDGETTLQVVALPDAVRSVRVYDGNELVWESGVL